MKYLDPKNDLIFKKIFGQHPEILKNFLNSMLPLPEGKEIVELAYLSPEMVPETYLEKFTSVDVRCTDNYGRQFMVEMQMNWTTAFKQRVLFNASKAYVTQSEKGADYIRLKPVYALNLINQTYLPEVTEYYHHYAVVHLQNTNERLEGLEFVFIELDKFKAKNIREKKLQVLWLRFLTEISEKTVEVSKELLDYPSINQAIMLVNEASLSKEEKLLYDKNWDRISSEKTILAEVKAEGRAEGEQIGIAKGEQIGIAKGEQIGMWKFAIKKLRSGISEEDVVSLTELDIEIIRQLNELIRRYGSQADQHLIEIIKAPN